MLFAPYSASSRSAALLQPSLVVSDMLATGRGAFVEAQGCMLNVPIQNQLHFETAVSDCQPDPCS